MICACGCKNKIQWKPYYKYYTPKYIKGHHKPRLGDFIDSTNKNTMYTRAKNIKRPDRCEFSHFKQCVGVFEVHHIDHNICNNSPENLIQVCHSHHRLIHSGRFDIKNPKSMNYRIDKSGKRRYFHEVKI